MARLALLFAQDTALRQQMKDEFTVAVPCLS